MRHACAACAATFLVFAPHHLPSLARVDAQSTANQSSRPPHDSPSTGNGWQVSPAWNPDGVRVATGTLWVTNVDTGQAEQWTSDREGERDPRWSPDGQCLAYVTAREREGIDVKCAGAATRRLVADGHAPQWSADGKRILYAKRSAGRLQILTIPADGQGTATELLPWLASDLPGGWGAQWHPDGERLIVVGWYKPGKLGLWAVAPTAGPPLGNPLRPRRDPEAGGLVPHARPAELLAHRRRHVRRDSGTGAGTNLAHPAGPANRAEPR